MLILQQPRKPLCLGIGFGDLRPQLITTMSELLMLGSICGMLTALCLKLLPHLVGGIALVLPLGEQLFNAPAKPATLRCDVLGLPSSPFGLKLRSQGLQVQLLSSKTTFACFVFTFEFLHTLRVSLEGTSFSLQLTLKLDYLLLLLGHLLVSLPNLRDQLLELGLQLRKFFVDAVQSQPRLCQLFLSVAVSTCALALLLLQGCDVSLYL
mmetsp:Transcript_87346/g.250298  ORF Transcript_87346/g.250298 Transcript_87346/m.250298 type:complete len:209 (-) Transcript_87346:1267-1893(-)